MIPERRRLAYALLLSLLIHTWLLRLTFGGQGLWLPSLGLWQDRRTELPHLRLVLEPAQVAGEPSAAQDAQPAQQARIDQPPVAETPPPTFPAPTPQRPAAAIVPKIDPTPGANPTNPTTEAATAAVPSPKRLRTERLRRKTPASIPLPPVIAVAPSDDPQWVVPAIPPLQMPDIGAAPSASSIETAPLSTRDAGDATRIRIEQPSERPVEPAKPEASKQEEQSQAQPPEEARPEAARPEVARVEAERARAAAQAEAARVEAERAKAAQAEAARVEAERAQAARAEAARVEAERANAAQAEAARIEAERAQAARTEAARVEAERAKAAQAEAARVEAERAKAAQAEAARVEAERAKAAQAEAARVEAERAKAAQAEAARVEAERAKAAQAEAARVEAERAKAAQAEAARVEAERAKAAQAEAARVEAEQAETARREAARRAMGRQLDEEAARRQAAAASGDPSHSLPPPWSLRRYKLFGRTDPNAELILWAEAWERKIQLNTMLETIREAAKRPHTDPLVTVAVRSDGSVESVTFVLSSGVPAIDEAIRRIVDSQKPYPGFPPNVAREYDVIEIRRTWYFDPAIRLH